MKQIKQILALSLIALLSLASCDSVEEAQIVADDFYDALNTKNESKMESLFDQEAVIDAGIKDQFYNVFDQHEQAFGIIISYERYAFSTNTDNGITTVTLKFNCLTENGSTVYEKLGFVERADGYKIIQFEYNIDKSVIDKVEN